MEVNVKELAGLQTHTDKIRNICILAHVDHGKTTMSDHLIGSNGLIHPKLCGELRYLDSRDDEQQRGITMKSSSITLIYVPGASKLPGGARSCSAQQRLDQGYLVNLIDSPGHVDFCSEVSTAARLSDGALVVVDAVEGVCIQTHAVLRQAWEEKVKLCLVINKLDRLIMELRLTPAEAYVRLRGILTHVNMIISAFQSERFISEADAVLAHEDAKTTAGAGHDTEYEEEEEEEQAFSPEKGNVAFTSAYDGWGFRTSDFAAMCAAKLGCKAGVLDKALWGDYAFNPKTKRIIRIKASQQDKLKPLFVQMVLEPLWKAYSACEPGADAKPLLSKMVTAFNLDQVPEKAVAHPDPRTALRSVLRAWLPLSEAVLGMAVEQLPAPNQAIPERMDRLFPPQPGLLPPGVREEAEAVEQAVASCSGNADAPVVVYVSKMVATPAGQLPRRPNEGGPKDPLEERFLAFGRVFSGTVRDGQELYVLPSVYDPGRQDPPLATVRVDGLYMMMGRGLERLSEVPVGNVLALGGFDTAILKTATLCTTPNCRPMSAMHFQAAPIVRVAVEAEQPAHQQAVRDGLQLLHRADPFVEIDLLDSGEHVIGAAGEVHLETVLKDLQTRFARVALKVSPPLVAFRESVFYPPEQKDVIPKPVKVVEATTANGVCTLRIRAHPLPQGIVTALSENETLIRRALLSGSTDPSGNPNLECPNGVASFGNAGNRTEQGHVAQQALSALSERLHREAGEEESDLSASQQGMGVSGFLARAWQLGPRQAGPNLLLSSGGIMGIMGVGPGGGLWDVPPRQIVHVSKKAGGGGGPSAASGPPLSREEERDAAAAEQAMPSGIDLPLGTPEAAAILGFGVSHDSHDSGTNPNGSLPLAPSETASGPRSEASADVAGVSTRLRHDVEAGVCVGFQLATAAGPLCDEPLWGVAFEVEARLNPGESGGPFRLAEDTYGPFTGQVSSAARQAMRRAVTEAGPRLVEAMFLCEVATTSDALSGVYSVLGQRRAQVVREDLREGSDLFSVHAYLPAASSFGFAEDMRRMSSGAASPSLMLSHWQRLQVDPFFAPTTEEEREEWGEEGQGVGAGNLARALIDKVRSRKGLPVDRKVVESATKQRTRARKV